MTTGGGQQSVHDLRVQFKPFLGGVVVDACEVVRGIGPLRRVPGLIEKC